MRTPLIVVLLLLAAGCSRIPMLPGLSAHKIDIQQGNYITQDMVAKLKPGMTRSQVRFILGTPLLADPFHAHRWDYVYQMQKRGQTVEFRKIFLTFEDDRLARIEGDVVPAAPGAEAKPAGSAPPGPARGEQPAAPAQAPAAAPQQGAKP